MGADLSTELTSSAEAQDAGAAWFAVPLKPREQPMVDAHVVQALCIPADVPNELELLQVRLQTVPLHLALSCTAVVLTMCVCVCVCDARSYHPSVVCPGVDRRVGQFLRVLRNPASVTPGGFAPACLQVLVARAPTKQDCLV